MNIVGLMLVRNEEWILGFSARAALQWVDHLVICNHASTDRTAEIMEEVRAENKDRVLLHTFQDSEYWEEMALRQAMLEVGMPLRPSHIALVDADEALTSNLLFDVRDWVSDLRGGVCLDLPMVPIWRSLDTVRSDNCVWTRGVISTAVKCLPGMGWKAKSDGYTHHSRIPRHCDQKRTTPNGIVGGNMHLQFANHRRLVSKHAWYKMTERLRWPTRDQSSVKNLNQKYGKAVDENGLQMAPVPAQYWTHYIEWKSLIDLDSPSWFEDECKRLLAKHGREPFAGLDLFGVV